MTRTTKQKIGIAAVLGGIALLALHQREKQEPQLATVDGTVITEDAFRYWWNRDQPTKDNADTRWAVLDQLIDRTALANRARAAGLDSDPEIVEAIESLLIARLREKELQPQLAAIEISDNEARAAYEAQPEKFATDPQKHVAVLWFDTRGQQPLADRYAPRLEAVRTQLDPSTETFGALALKNSEHRASRHRGGDIGWISAKPGQDKWRNAIAEIATDLTEPGQLSEVVTNPHGVFLVKLLEQRAGGTRPFDEVKDQIVAALKSNQRQQLLQAFQTIESDVQIDTDRLAAIDQLPIQNPSDEPTATFTPSFISKK